MNDRTQSGTHNNNNTATDKEADPNRKWYFTRSCKNTMTVSETSHQDIILKIKKLKLIKYRVIWKYGTHNRWSAFP
jgi:hypothetical protein